LANLVILTADELKGLNPLERQAARRAARQQPLVRLILRTFLQRGGLIPVEDIVAGSPDSRAEALHDSLVALDDEDVIRVRAGQIDVAYPFSGSPTPFRLRLSGGRATPVARPTRSASRRWSESPSRSRRPAITAANL
jgi:hypothetical protein